MKIIACITDDDIRCHVEDAVWELESNGFIHFTDSEARAAFIDDCVECEIDKFGMYEHDPFGYCPDYVSNVIDMAKLYDIYLDNE